MSARDVTTCERARAAVQLLRYELLTSELADADKRKPEEHRAAVRLSRALAFLELAALALEDE